MMKCEVAHNFWETLGMHQWVLQLWDQAAWWDTGNGEAESVWLMFSPACVACHVTLNYILCDPGQVSKQSCVP